MLIFLVAFTLIAVLFYSLSREGRQFFLNNYQLLIGGHVGSWLGFFAALWARQFVSMPHIEIVGVLLGSGAIAALAGSSLPPRQG